MRHDAVRLHAIGFVLAAALSCAGCTYITDRGNDLLDIVWADFGAGLGVAIDGQVTSFCGGGLGYYAMNKYGLTRRTCTEWSESGVGLILVRHVTCGEHFVNVFRPKEGGRFTVIVNVDGFRTLFGDVSGEAASGNISITNPRMPRLNVLDADVGVAAGLLGARLGVSPGEALDFLLGWFGADIGRDDSGTPAVKEFDANSNLLFVAIGQDDEAAVSIWLRNFPELRGARKRATVWPRAGGGFVRGSRWTPLHFAAAKGAWRAARILIGCKADVDARDSTGRTPLHVAAEAGSRNVTAVLLANGADANAKNDGGKTALALAKRKHREEVAKVLRAYGVEE